MTDFIEANFLTLASVAVGFLLGVIFTVKNPNRRIVQMFAHHMKD